MLTSLTRQQNNEHINNTRLTVYAEPYINNTEALLAIIDRWFENDLGDQFTTVWDLYIHHLAMSKRQ